MQILQCTELEPISQMPSFRPDMQELWKEGPLCPGMQTKRKLQTQNTECKPRTKTQQLAKKATNQNGVFIELKE